MDLLPLTRSPARVLLHLPGKMTMEEGARRVIQRLVGSEVILVLLGRPRSPLPEQTSFFQMAQINQTILNTFFASPTRLLIIEASSNLGQFVLPQETGRILTLSSDFKSLEELTETARFLNGPRAKEMNIRPLDLARYLGEIGYLLCDVPQCTTLQFNYQSLPVTIQLTPEQYREYLSRLEREREFGRREPFSAQQVTNFLYPPELQALHSLPREQRPTVLPDLPTTAGGWITPDIINQLEVRSPKLHWSIQYLRQNPGRHILWTNFNESNGARVISSILSLAGFEVISVTGTDPVPQRYRKVEEFNRPSSRTKVLVSNLYAFAGFQSILSVLIFEQHPSDSVLNSYLRQIATSSDQRGVSVIFLIGVGPNNEQTIEITNYLLSSEAMISRDTILELLKTGEINPEELEKYRRAFRLPGLTPQEIQTALLRTFQRVTF